MVGAYLKKGLKKSLISLLALGNFYYISGPSINAETLFKQIEQAHPNNLKVLLRKPKFKGEYLLGIYGIEKDAFDEEVRRFKLWHQNASTIKIAIETVRCSPEEPLRVKRDKTNIYLRRINPGGIITSANREDHLVWWAACFPELTGKNPSELKEKAKSMGFSTFLAESQEILKAPSQ